jgi:hypothetical protein
VFRQISAVVGISCVTLDVMSDQFPANEKPDSAEEKNG